MKTTTKKLLAELQGLLEAPSDTDKHRMIAVASLCSTVCVALACGHDIKEEAARCLSSLRRFPEAEWPALFDEARASMGRTSSERDTPPRLAALEALIEAVQQT